MTDGMTALKRFQIGYESTAGTAVAATRKMVGKGYIRETPTIYQPDDDERGSFVGLYRTEIAGKDAEWGFESDCLYEDVIDWLTMGLKGNVTPQQQAMTTGYLWTFTPSMDTTVPTVKTATIESGDNVDVREAEYAMLTSLEISGAVDEALKCKAEGFARQLSSSSFTAALADNAVNAVMGQTTKLFVDDIGGTIGSTELSDTLLDFSWRLETGAVPGKRMNGNLYFATHAFKRRNVTLDVTMAVNSDAVAERAYLLSQAGRLIRLEATGPLISGSTYNSLKVDGAYKVLSVSEPQDMDGFSVLKFSARAFYDSTYAKDAEVAVVAARSAL